MSSATVVECILDLLKNQKNCDVIFIVGESKERISCHQLILSARSPVFEIMFTERWKSKEVQIPDVEPSVFHQFLQFVYGDVFTTNLGEAIDLLYIAHKYQVDALIEKCEILMKSKLQLSDAIRIYQAAGQFGVTALQQQAGDLMAKKFAQIIHNTSFMLMDEDTLLDLLPREDLAVEELQLFEALLRWSCTELEDQSPAAADQRRVLEKLLPLVRFPLMKLQDFRTKVVWQNILNTDECLAIETYLTSDPAERVELQAKLGFPWQPRSLVRTECKVELYEPDIYEPGNFSRQLNFTSVSNHVETLQFSFSWKKLPDKINSNNPASLAAVILRGPNHSTLRNSSFGSNSFLSASLRASWIVSLKLRERNSANSSGEWTSFEQNNIEIFGDRYTEVTVNKPFVLKTGCFYQIVVSFTSPVFLPPPGEQSATQDFSTRTRLKKTCAPIKNQTILLTNVKLLQSPNIDPMFRSFSPHGLAPDQRTSHCIRFLKLNVCSS